MHNSPEVGSSGGKAGSAEEGLGRRGLGEGIGGGLGVKSKGLEDIDNESGPMLHDFVLQHLTFRGGQGKVSD